MGRSQTVESIMGSQVGLARCNETGHQESSSIGAIVIGDG